MNPDRPVFSLKAFLLAPIPVPLVCSAFFAADMTKPVGLFLMSFIFGLIVSCLGTTALVASLWPIARARPVTKTVTAFAGLILGAAR